MRDTSDMDQLNKLYARVVLAEQEYQRVDSGPNEWQVRLALRDLEGSAMHLESVMASNWTRRGLVGALALVPFAALAHDWTGGENAQLNAWFMSLHREDNFSCCGLGDAYPCEILKEPDPKYPGMDTGMVQITDGRALEIHMGDMPGGVIKRPALRKGTQIPYPFFKQTPPKYGNPTNTAWIFLSVYEGDPPGVDSNSVGQVYCVVPLPPSV